LKRTDDKQITFSSAYNLGNSLFKQGDFQGAAQAFKQSIKINPGDEDSKYNYGLALKTIEENRKKEEEKQQENQEQEQEQNKARDKKNKDDQKKDGPHKKQDQNQADQNQDKEDQSGQSNERKEQANQDSDQDDQAQNKQEQGESAEQTEKSGQPGQDAGTSEEYQAGAMSKNEAEAFLDNIGEDPAAINRLRFSGKEQKTASGKDW